LKYRHAFHRRALRILLSNPAVGGLQTDLAKSLAMSRT
jgi:hypothetical protein